MPIVHEQQAWLVPVAEPKAFWKLCRGSLSPSRKRCPWDRLFPPPAPSLQAQGQVGGGQWETAQGQGQLSPAPLGAEMEGKSPALAGRKPALGVCVGLSETTELQLHLGRAEKDVVSSYSSLSPTSQGEVSAESAAEEADADRDSLKALCGC